jgi:hypothetical protein
MTYLPVLPRIGYLSGLAEKTYIWTVLDSYERTGPPTKRFSADVIAPPPGELVSETNDNSLSGHPAELRHASCLVGDAEAQEEYRRAGPTRGLKRRLMFPKYTYSEPVFRALLLTRGASEVEPALV